MSCARRYSEELPRVLEGEIEADPFQEDYEGFEGRRPVIWHPGRREIYLGHPDTFHSDMYGQFDLWRDEMKINKGYAAGGEGWGGGPLVWYGREPLEHELIAKALQPYFPNQDLLAAPVKDEWSEGW